MVKSYCVKQKKQTECVSGSEKYVKAKNGMRSAKTTARLTQRNIFKNNISAGQTSLLQV